MVSTLDLHVMCKPIMPTLTTDSISFWLNYEPYAPDSVTVPDCDGRP